MPTSHATTAAAAAAAGLILPPSMSSSSSISIPHPHPQPSPQNVSLGSPRTLRRPGPRKPSSGIGKIATASTPNLRGHYNSPTNTKAIKATTHPVPIPSLQRKGSQAALTSTSLASLPDASGSYALATLSTNSPSARASKMVLSPLTPRAGPMAYDSAGLGDTVDVPGNMHGTVRFIGTVQGKKGIFAGVELHPEFALRGKNNGDVDGISYFTTSIEGAGIFLPLNKAIKRDSPPNSATSSFPMTPVSATGGLRAGTQNSTNFTPPTSTAAQFSKPPAPPRVTSPLGKQPRPSLSRPESPLRKLPMASGARPSMGAPAKPMPRHGSPTQSQNQFSQSARGPPTPGDPGKRGMLQSGRNFSMGPRSISALSGPSAGFATDEETMMTAGNGIARPREAGRPGSALRVQRGPSRQTSAQDEEIERLRAEVADRERQIRDQTAALAEMESSLAEVQSLMEQAELPAPRRGSIDDKDTTQLRALLREKNEKIAMLTAEFDAHRADFRSTIDTLELASTETERVYEKKIEELMLDIQQIQERTSDVDAVATQLKQLEELVQELEEGLEDARRGEAEARGEVEFLRGEVERTRAELRREREKAAGGAKGADGTTNGDQSALFKEIELKEDEIRGLKAIIHSLSRDSVPSDTDRPSASADDNSAREKLERQVAELRALLDTKNTREEELEHELDNLRRGSSTTLRGTDQSSLRGSHDIVISASDLGPRSDQQAQRKAHNRVRTLDTMPESDGLSSITENSTLWCELCETSGHDILTCTNMFGQKTESADNALDDGGLTPIVEDKYKIAPLSPRMPPPSIAQPVVPSGVSDKLKPLPPNMMDPGPVAGKESGVVDHDAWCALCEKDGHNSVDCPFEDAF